MEIGDEESEPDDRKSTLDFYRIDHDSAFHLATFSFPIHGGWMGHEVLCGAKLAPGEQGLCVIAIVDYIVSGLQC